jgi:hypothetical protein
VRGALNFDLAPISGEPIATVTLYLDGHRVGSPSGALPRRLTIPALAGTRSHKVRLHEATAGGFSRNVTRTLKRCSMTG